MKTKPKVLMAMSGGVDSSVAAALLVRSGKYEVVGVYMLNYDNNQKGAESCWLPDYRDALRVAAHLGIPLLKWDFTKEYHDQVMTYMFREYEAGRTPNPDVLCNTFIKFGSWLERARQEGFDFIATGHYAQVKKGALLQAKDDNKDQTYFLHQLQPNQLAHALFPIGHLKKPQVRKLAQKFDLPTATKAESMGICFIGEVPMKEFLAKRIPPQPGNVVSTDGKFLGTHDGLSFYTIGQRDLGIAGGERLYVVEKRSAKNELVVGTENDPALYKKEIVLSDLHWTSGQAPRFPLQCEVRLRHRQALQKCVVESQKSSSQSEEVVVRLKKPERAVTPGQFAVFYKKGECLGGGVIV